MSATLLDVEAVRARYSALDRPLALFDGPGGTQCPDEVIDAIATYLRKDNANIGAPYETSVHTMELIERARAAAGRWLGCHPDEVAFGQSMTSLNFLFTRAFARTLERGDEIVVTKLDHDANVAPWLELEHDLGIVVRFVDVHDDLTLDLDDLERQLSDRTKVVAFPIASNAVGTTPEVARVVELAHAAGALAWADAVHYGPHGPIDVAGWDAIVAHETGLGQRFLAGLPEPVQLYGLRTMSGRVPTFCFNLPGRTAEEVATELAAREIAVWHGDYYALEVMRRLGLEGAGAVRAGIVHYNTAGEVDRLLEALADLC